MDSISNHFISSFLGYGNENAEVCIIGIKERGDGTEQDTVARIHTWQECGMPTLVDALQYASQYDKINPRLSTMQKECLANKTWGKVRVLSDRFYRENRGIFEVLSSSGKMCNVNIQGLPRESIKSVSEYGQQLDAVTYAECEKLRKVNIMKLVNNDNFKLILFHGEDSWLERYSIFPDIGNPEIIPTSGAQNVGVFYQKDKIIIKCKHLAYISNDALDIIVDLWQGRK